MGCSGIEKVDGALEDVGNEEESLRDTMTRGFVIRTRLRARRNGHTISA